MEKLISAKACVWDVTQTYLNKDRNAVHPSSPSKLLFHQKSETKGNPPPTKTKTVELNGHITVFVLGKKNEYYSNNGQSLTGLIMTSSATSGNKLRIY